MKRIAQTTLAIALLAGTTPTTQANQACQAIFWSGTGALVLGVAMCAVYGAGWIAKNHCNKPVPLDELPYEEVTIHSPGDPRVRRACGIYTLCCGLGVLTAGLGGFGLLVIGGLWCPQGVHTE